ncbi:MAG TPA: 6-carboxytetrahydropterin synthase [Dehalococcoidia bacterium]|jgi:6-pyruvoyltetrahydropterin/6-carboxytetrahydropterin synthase|nr:6-carboxytetrahydropterin synthase [Dehalococcoidia bacterium]
MSEPERGSVRAARVERQRLKFAAAHMATFAHTLEPLHGHNYAVIFEAEGRLREEGWVLDFGVLKRIGRELCDGLDHHFLLQRPGRGLTVRRHAGAVEVRFGERRYVFPEQDVLELPIANTTAELIAEWLWTRVVEALRAEGIDSVSRLGVGVEEAPGQTGWYAAPVP